MSTFQRTKTWVRDFVRRNGRGIAWSPEWMNLGNLLYLGLWASRSDNRFVLAHARHEPALSLFPHLRERLFISPSETRFTDQRLMPWTAASRLTHGAFDSPDGVEDFVREMILVDTPLLNQEINLDDTLVVNVRRGDYYSVPKNQAEFGMDQASYIHLAATMSVETLGTPSRIVVISDDIPWCRANLDRTLQALAKVEYLDGPLIHDLRMLIHAPRLVIPNSTFSYWGAYIGDTINPERQVIAPWLFSRHRNGGAADQLLPHWKVIEDLPGGWEATGP